VNLWKMGFSGNARIRRNTMKQLITTLGPKSADELGLILPHEHIFVDLGPIEEANYRNATAADVIPVMAPQIEAIKAQGVTALVECTPEGVGRRADIDRAVSEATNFPVVMPTGIYREPWVPQWAQTAHEDELAEWLLGELTGEIADTGVQAAWIKVSAGDDGITPVEAKILRAAARAGARTGAIIGSHTIRGRVVRDQLDIIEDAGYTADRFIWIHTQAEPDTSLHLEMAQRGAWLEFDAIGSDGFSDDYFIERILALLDAGFGEKLLLSHDRGWYDPSKPGGGVPNPYTVLVDRFLPKLRAAGVDQETVEQLTHRNPFNAYAR
jgi:phosphotriesterase-related protein